MNREGGNKSLGILCAVGAAAIYGFMPIMAKYVYMDGGNTISLSFFRNLFSLPALFLFLRFKGISLKVTRKQFKTLCALAVFGACGTSLMLYAAYNYISVGLTTCIHYVYPMLVAITCVTVFKEKLSKAKVISLVLSAVGMLLFLEGDLSLNVTGFLLAFGSGVAYSVFLILMDKSGIRVLEPFKITFYTALISTALMGIFGGASGQLQFNLSATGWVVVIVMAVLVSAIANSLVPVAVNHVGSTVTAILGMFEPIISVVTGILILSEVYSPQSFLGCALIIGAVILLTLEKPDDGKTETQEEPGE